MLNASFSDDEEKELRMKRGSLGYVLVLLSLMCLLAVPAFTQSRNVTNVVSEVLDDFDDPQESRYIVRGSKFIADAFVDDQGMVQSQHVRTFPTALYREEPEDRELRAFGINAAFDRKGYNYLEIIPASEDEDGNLAPDGIAIPGKVRDISLWVWGSNRDYSLEVQLRDHRGIVHTLDFGSISYRGWDNLKVDVPSYIPQEVVYVPQRQGLEIVKFVLWTSPRERVDEFYVYFDELRVTTDTFEEPFDGEKLADPDHVEQLWNQAGGE
ncbi:MAG: flagellar filament outer layer protein FlaA [Spirochaetaceae bacterium]